MRRAVLVLMLILSPYALLHGCTVDKISPTVANSGVLATGMDGSQAASSVFRARDLFTSSAALLMRLGKFGVAVMTADPGLSSVSVPVNCASAGNYTYEGTSSGGAYSLTITFNGCRENGYQYEGSYALSGSADNMTINLVTMNIFNFNDDYTVLLSFIRAAGFSFVMTGSETSSNAVYTITANGSLSAFDYDLLNTSDITYTGLKIDATVNIDAASADETTSITVNGILGESWNAARVAIAATDFKIDTVKRWSATAAPPRFLSSDSSLNGKVKFTYRPISYCFGGELSVATQTPFRKMLDSARTVQGMMLINGIGMVQANAGGDIAVTVSPDAPLHYPQERDLMKSCAFCTLRPVMPEFVGLTGTTTGDTMTVTLTWYGGDTSDMDLHLKYYDTATPSPATPETWHMDWHQFKRYPLATGSCTDPAGIAFDDAFDLDGNHDGTCDVGLDFDDTQGYGPEHITALKLPAGYYIVSVNNFSLDADPFATTYLAIHVGESVFGPYVSTLRGSGDGEGIDIASWFRVADVRVNADGTVDVLAPNASLDPWGTPPH